MTPNLVPDPRWQTCTGKKCRYTHCQAPAVAEFARSYGATVRFWPYCSAHVEDYGAVLVGSTVMRRERVEESEAAILGETGRGM